VPQKRLAQKKKSGKQLFSRVVRCGMRRMRLVQAPYKIGGDNIVVGSHHCHNLEQHILRDSELLARRRRRARVFARQFLWQSGVLQRQYTGAFEAHRGQIDRLILLGARNL